MIEEEKLNALELFGENEYLHKEIERLNNIIKEVREYIEKVETLAVVDKKIIFSISTLKAILDKGVDI